MPGHETLAKEAGLLLDLMATRLEKAAQAPEPHDPQRCTGCPICVALTYLDSHKELSAQLAQGALVIVTALRQYLDQPAHSAGTTEPVQHIDIR